MHSDTILQTCCEITTSCTRDVRDCIGYTREANKKGDSFSVRTIPMTDGDDAPRRTSPTGTTYPAYIAARRCMLERQVEFIKILRAWDEDGDGCVSVKEFRDAARVLLLDAGLRTSVPRVVLDELFAEIDVFDTHNIPFDDLVVALRHMPVPDETAAAEHCPQQSPLQKAGNVDALRSIKPRVRRRSRSLPSSPISSPISSPLASPRPLRPPPTRQQLHQPLIESDECAPDGTHSPPPAGRVTRSASLPHIRSGLSVPGLLHGNNPIGRHVGAARVQPPRQTNLPRIASGASFVVGSGGARSVAAASQRSGVSGCSHSTASAAVLSPAERAQRRIERERELTARLERKQLPGFNTPAVGHYDLSAGSIARHAQAARNTQRGSAWAADESAQHPLLDKLGRVMPTTKTSVGDPGKYVSHMHEMGVARGPRGFADKGIGALSFSSAVPRFS